jgi:hypothetical protein
MKQHFIQVWSYLLTEPLKWIRVSYLQPSNFWREFEKEDRVHRIVPMLRLTLPLLLPSYLFSLLLIVSLGLSEALYTVFPYFGNGWFTAACLAVIVVVIPLMIGVLYGIRYGIYSVLLIAAVIGLLSGMLIEFGIGILYSVREVIVPSFFFCTVEGLLLGMALNGIVSTRMLRSARGYTLSGLVFGLLVALVMTIGVLPFGIAAAGQGNTVGPLGSGMEEIVFTCLLLVVCCVLGYYRLPLYLISWFSLLQVYQTSRKTPSQVFTALQHSALYWDERILLPLPYLKSILLTAIQQDARRALDEIIFIATERPLQIHAARMASLEITMRDLELCKSLSAIVEASERLGEILPPELGLIDMEWVTPFSHLRDASQDAARCLNSPRVQIKRSALEDMERHLRKIFPNVAFKEEKMNRRLGNIVETWLEVTQREQETLKRVPQEAISLENPYKPGQVLKRGDTLFVGRWDLAQQLDEALSRGDDRPTFLLQGERRMGKSTTLVQLPNLLGSRYLPIFCDLQEPGICSSSATLLGGLAAKIAKEMNARGIRTKSLKYEWLNLTHKEADVYHKFSTWFEEIEDSLKQEERTLLLTFDEFEKLGEENRTASLNLNLLLDWFRNIIQYHPQLALLFSGVQTLGEMETQTGMPWANYFVNVQILHVGFLRTEEARQLITCPVPNFPGREIFSDDVVDEIIKETGCHPFLIQAVCSELIYQLNMQGRKRATGRDVEASIQAILAARWDGYFRDLWNRSDDPQRICLTTLQTFEVADLHHIKHYSGLDEQTVRHTMHTLLKRDLVIQEEEKSYKMATPIFRKWVEQWVER